MMNDDDDDVDVDADVDEDDDDKTMMRRMMHKYTKRKG